MNALNELLVLDFGTNHPDNPTYAHEILIVNPFHDSDSFYTITIFV